MKQFVIIGAGLVNGDDFIVGDERQRKIIKLRQVRTQD